MVGQVASRADVYFSCFWRLEAQVRVLADSVLGEGRCVERKGAGFVPLTLSSVKPRTRPLPASWSGHLLPASEQAQDQGGAVQ